MNIKQLHIGVNLGVQKIASHQRDDFMPQEIDFYLNNAVNDFITEQYSYLKQEKRDTGGQFVNENLRTLIKTAIINYKESPPPGDETNATSGSYYPNSIVGPVPQDYLYYVFGIMRVNDELHNLRYIQPKGIKPFLATADNSPIFREFPLFISDRDFSIICDSLVEPDDCNNITITYISKPDIIEYTEGTKENEYVSLPPHTHKMIVDIAVQTMLRDLSPPTGE